MSGIAETMIRRHLLISGRVQGVWYRRHTQQKAQELRLQGWVRNLPTGAVEACVEGERVAVEQLTAWCRQGPPNARVDGVAVTDSLYGAEFRGFAILP